MVMWAPDWPIVSAELPPSAPGAVLDKGQVVADGAPADLVRSEHPAVMALVAAPIDQARRLAGLVR